MVIRRIVRRGFAAAGLELRRLPRCTPGAEANLDRDLRDELAELDHELRRFAKVAPDATPWSQPDEAREYLSAQRIRFFHEVLRVCRDENVAIDGARIADIGSGTGYLLRLLASRRSPSTLVGYDTYRDITRLARHLCPTAEFREESLHGIDGECFDVLFCTEVLEHLVDPGQALARLKALLAEGGCLVLTVPNGRTDTFPPLEPLDDGRGYWGHINFWSPESWPLFLSAAEPDASISCGTLATGQNWAALRWS